MIIGIDPGVSGAIAVMNNKGVMVSVYDMPVVEVAYRNKTRRIVDVLSLGTLLNDLYFLGDNTVAFCEKVGAMPGQGVTSMFNMGYSYGLVHASVQLNKIPLTDIRPVEWKKRFGLSKSKEASRHAALRLWPDFQDELKLKKNENRAEAMLIAQYGREKYPAAPVTRSEPINS